MGTKRLSAPRRIHTTGLPQPADGADSAMAAKAKHPPVAGRASPTALRRIPSANVWTGLSAIAACAAALFAGWAAWETHRRAIETNKSPRAGVWLQLLAQCGGPQRSGRMSA